MRISASGYGAGGRDTPGQPNLLRLLVGEEVARDSAAEPIAIMETVIDDSSPAIDRLRERTCCLRPAHGTFIAFPCR